MTLAADGTRLEGEDLFLAADGGPQVRTEQDRYAVRFHLHPSIKATRLTDGHGALLIMPNKEAWTFHAGEHRVHLEDDVYLAGNGGPRRAVQMVINGHARSAPRVTWSFQQDRPPSALATAARRAAAREAEPQAAAVIVQFSARREARRSG